MELYSMCDEILTVQTGPLANRVCLHLWNYEAYFPVVDWHTCASSDISKHSGCIPYVRQHVFCDRRSGLTIPRTLALDLPGSLDYGFDSDDAGLDGQDNCPFWDGQVHSVYRSSLSPLSQTVNCCAQWTSCFNPFIRRLWRENDMICTLPNAACSPTSHRKTEETETLTFAQGVDVLRPSSALADDVDNRLRRLLERCDRPSALRLVTDAESGFVGLDIPLLDWWLDEFPKRPVITFALYNSSDVKNQEVRVQRMAQAHQLILATRMESADEGLTHATWIPLDISSVSDPYLPGCLSSGITAAGITCLNTALQLDPNTGGLCPDEWVALSQKNGVRRMLTARMGFEHENLAGNDTLRWKTANPYWVDKDQIPDASRWREASLRGVRMNPVGDRILQFAAIPSGTDRPTDLFGWTSDSDVVTTYPRVEPGSRVSLFSQLADFPIRPHIDFGPSTRCTQPHTVRVATLLDAPGDHSVEWQQLRNLVVSFKRGPLRSPLDGIEPDQWDEFMESGRRSFVDP
ncbi:hypothetical protein FBUS_08390 [Fasciolopsis buskii]|uniref:Uncharacterized protein n=1 Tax=Fasciolopsis buskii TaxID=27845 RepID=A0A8E0RLU8_9TREM|nr:hypothetical protein FBUS_08390 [Fasciolopsis buski]